MSSNLLDTYRKNWPRVGAVLGMAALGGASTLIAGKRLDKLRALSVMNFIALLVRIIPMAVHVSHLRRHDVALLSSHGPTV